MVSTKLEDTILNMFGDRFDFWRELKIRRLLRVRAVAGEMFGVVQR